MDRFKCVFCGSHGDPREGYWCDRSCEELQELVDYDFYMVHQLNNRESRAVAFSNNSIPSLVLSIPLSEREIFSKIFNLGEKGYSVPEYVQDMGSLFEMMVPTEDEKEEYEGLIKELKAPAKTKKDIRKELNEMPF